MIVTYISKNYAPERVRARYVRRTGTGYQFCEVGTDRRYDLRQGTVEDSELPDGVREAADNFKGQAFGYVPWPVTHE